MTADDKEPPGAALIPARRDMVQYALERGATIDVIERVAALQERRDSIEAKRDWAAAIASFKAECPPIIKRNAVNDRAGNQIYKFAGYDDIKAVTIPLERKYGIVTGFSYEQTTDKSLKAVLRVTVGSHTEEFTGAVPVPAAGAGGVNATQLMGQAQSYVKRYLYLAAFDLVVAGEDSDAVGLIETVTLHDIGRINEAIDDCQKAGRWFDDSLKKLLAVYEIESLDQLPLERLNHVLADLDRQKRGGKK